MIRHIVAFKFKANDAEGRRSAAEKAKARLEALVPLIPQIKSLSVGISLGLIDAHWDAVLVGEYETIADLEAYQANPDHVAASSYVGTLTASRAIVDYEL